MLDHLEKCMDVMKLLYNVLKIVGIFIQLFYTIPKIDACSLHILMYFFKIKIPFLIHSLKEASRESSVEDQFII